MRMKLSELTVREPFKGLFPVEPDVVQALTADMKSNGFDAARSIIVWKASAQERIVVDGHMRLAAARKARLTEIHVTIRRFANEDAAFAFAIASQRDRRNLTKEQIATAIARAELARNGSTDQANVARSVGERNSKGQVQGSTKDPVKQAVIEKAAGVGIAERTAKRGLANARAERTAPRTAKKPELVTIDELKELHQQGIAAARAVGPALTTLAKSGLYEDAMALGGAAMTAHGAYAHLIKKLDRYIDEHERKTAE